LTYFEYLAKQLYQETYIGLHSESRKLCNRS